MIQKSQVNFKNVNTEELGLYLSLTMSEKELEETGIRKHCAKRKRSGKKTYYNGVWHEGKGERKVGMLEKTRANTR